MSGKQALAICEPQAKLAGRSAADSYDSPSSGSRTRCTSFTGYSINCRTTSNSGGGGIAGGILEGLGKRKEAIKYILNYYNNSTALKQNKKLFNSILNNKNIV